MSEQEKLIRDALILLAGLKRKLECLLKVFMKCA